MSVWVPLLLVLFTGFSSGDVSELSDPPAPRYFRTAEMADAAPEPLKPGEPQEPELLEPSMLNPEEADMDAEEQVMKEAIVDSDGGDSQVKNQSESGKSFKVSCERRKDSETIGVILLNHTQDLMDLLNANSSECSLVLFFAPWCQFSANLAPFFNALPRVFPSMHFLALDASQHSSLSTRFGTVAVPNILLFQGVKPIARFNQSDRTLETLTAFITNQTGFEAGPDAVVHEEDFSGPVPRAPVQSIDWLLVFSVLFIIFFALYSVLCTESIRWLVPGHEHQE